jgi:transposase-like protein DUF772
MLCWIFIFGGLPIMMGQHDRSEGLFYYFRVEDQVPETHLLRLIEKHISFAFVREKLKASYSDAGRPSIDPELLLRILLIGYLYGITSERKLVDVTSLPLQKGPKEQDKNRTRLFQIPSVYAGVSVWKSYHTGNRGTCTQRFYRKS